MESGSGRKSNTCMISCFEVHLYCVLLKIKIKPHSKAQHTKDSKTVKRDVLTTVNTFVRIALQNTIAPSTQNAAANVCHLQISAK